MPFISSWTWVFEFDIPKLHRINGLRAYAGDMKIEIPWPQHTIYPNWGAVIRRADLDMTVAQMSQQQGAVIRDGTEAIAIVEDGELKGAELRIKQEGRHSRDRDRPARHRGYRRRLAVSFRP